MSPEAIEAILLMSVNVTALLGELKENADLNEEQREKLREATKGLEDRAHSLLND